MRQLEVFLSQCGSNSRLDKKYVVKKRNRYFFFNERLKKLASNDFFHAGVYLGKVKGRVFFPSFPLLDIIAKGKANKVVVDDKTEWLFICGRDVFKQGIAGVAGSNRKGSYTLILNEHGECLGFGTILHNLDGEKAGAVIRNISDIGDFLRRE